MKALWYKIVLTIRRTPGWLISLIVLLILVGLCVMTWVSLWYTHGSKLQIRIPAAQARVTVEGKVHLINKDWDLALPWKDETTPYGIHIDIPYEKTFTCDPQCPVLGLAQGDYEIAVAGMPGYHNWTGSIIVLPDTVGSFEIPADPVIDIKPFSFPPEIILQQNDDTLSIDELFNQVRHTIYNPFDRISYIQQIDRATIYDHKSRVRHDLLVDLVDVMMVKKSTAGFLIQTKTILYEYDPTLSSLVEIIGLRDQVGDYTLSIDGGVSYDGELIIHDPEIQGIHTQNTDIILSYPEGYYIFQGS